MFALLSHPLSFWMETEIVGTVHVMPSEQNLASASSAYPPAPDLVPL